MKWTLLYAAALFGIFLATRSHLETIRPLLGADAGSVLTRPWAQFTAPWLHNSWFHITYNLAILLLTMPIAVHAFGPKAIPLAIMASALTGFAVNLLLIQPMFPEHPANHARYIGASIAIFAGAGMAFTTWTGPMHWKAAALGGFFLYEAILATTNATAPFVGIYHAVGAIAGIGIGRALQ